MKTRILNHFSRMINAYLKLDQHSQSRLEKLQGRILTLELMPFHLIVQLIFTEEGLELREGGELGAETIVRGTPLQLLNVLLAKDRRDQFISESLEIEGNAEFAQQVMQLLEELDIDWEEQLAKIMGDTTSHKLGRFAQGIKNWYRNTTESVQEDINDYLKEEKLWVPPKETVTQFYDDIDQLRMDVDRLEARFNQLRSQILADEEVL